MPDSDPTLAELSTIGIPFTSDANTRAQAAQDFGHLIEGHATCVTKPTNAGQVVTLLRHANAHGLTVTPRGGGNSQSGQSVPQDGLSLDLTALDFVDTVDADAALVRVGAGATWRKVLGLTLKHGLVPRVMPLNLDLTVGGTLSAGGIGSTSHLEGAAAWHVAELEVVTGVGELVIAGPEREPELYGAVLGGVGRVAVMTAARLKLRPTASHVRTYFLAYDDLDALLDDQRSLSLRRAVAHMEGFCAATVMGLRKGPNQRRAPLALWSYGLHVSIEHDEHEPSSEGVLDGLHFSRRLHVEDDLVADFAARYDVRFEAMRVTGGCSRPAVVRSTRRVARRSPRSRARAPSADESDSERLPSTPARSF